MSYIDLPHPLIVTASYDRKNKIRVWTETKEKETKLIKEIDFHDSQVNSLAIHENWLAVAGFESIKVFDITSSYCTSPSIKKEEPPNHNQFTEFSLSKFCGSYRQMRRVYKESHRNETKIIFSNDGSNIFSCNEQGRITWYDFKLFKLDIYKEINIEKTISSMALHPNQEMMAIITSTGEIYLWNFFASNSLPFVFTAVSNSLISVDFSNNGESLAVLNSKGRIYVWNDLTKTLPSKKFKFIEDSESKYALKLKYSPDSKLLAVIGSHGNLKIYDATKDYQLLFYHPVSKPFTDQRPWIWDVAFSSDSKYLYFGTSDGYTRKWRIGKEGYERTFYPNYTKAISAIAVHE